MVNYGQEREGNRFTFRIPTKGDKRIAYIQVLPDIK